MTFIHARSSPTHSMSCSRMSVIQKTISNIGDDDKKEETQKMISDVGDDDSDTAGRSASS